MGKVHSEIKNAPPRGDVVEGEEGEEESVPMELPDDMTKPEYR